MNKTDIYFLNPLDWTKIAVRSFRLPQRSCDLISCQILKLIQKIISVEEPVVWMCFLILELIV